MEATQRHLTIVHTANTAGLDQAKAMIDEAPEYYYDLIVTNLATHPPAAPELKEVKPIAGYLASHPACSPEAQIYLAAYWERAVRLRNRLGKVGLIDAHLGSPNSIDESPQVS